jgi:heat shock protein HslJ
VPHQFPATISASRLAALCLAALTVVSCDDSLTAPSVANVVMGSSWTVDTIARTGTGAVAPPAPERFTLLFGTEGRVSVQADCNRCTGGYTVADGSVTIGALACTRAFCPSAPIDTDYVTILIGESAVQRKHGGLVLRSARGEVRFKGSK